ncbi:DUF2911 domain-containing protein [Salmonirosea aquatica]
MKKHYSLSLFSMFLICALRAYDTQGQALRIPSDQNFSNSTGRRLGATVIEVKWNAPGVKGREGKIWGTGIAPYGFTVLGYGSNVESPWRAGADEATTISFSTDVRINGKPLSAGKYGFFIALYPDSCTLIFNKNTEGWGSYFYDKAQDVLKVTTRQQKDLPTLQERLVYEFGHQTEQSVELALLWEFWKIPMTIEVDLKETVLASIKSQMSGALGFDPPSLIAAARWCLQNDTNLPEALSWITSASDASLGGIRTFNVLSTRARLQAKMGKDTEAASLMNEALENGSAIELHQHGRQLLSEKKSKEALAVFEQNYKKHKGTWPTNVGMMRGYSANGDLKKALEYAKAARQQAPDDVNRQSLDEAIKQLEQGKAL